MTLRVYNTLTRRKEEFKPLDPSNLRMYVCGPTVHDMAHIGNARPVVVFDVLYRLLRHIYGAAHVTYIRNITDVDDKINARALRDFPDIELNEAIGHVTGPVFEQFQKDVASLGCLPPTAQPRATEHIAGMVEMISVLINKGHAYVAAGEVLFDVGSMADYGALSGRKQEELKPGARIAVDAFKKNASDFVLWKQSEANEPGWDSPWGRGRPGWHIECSVMSKAYLGEVFDIHGGGLDLIFPHHENEIAQSRCAHDTRAMANYWMHNGFLQVEGQKMSKSLGNFITIRDLLNSEKFGGRRWSGETLRLAMLKTHYRQPIDWAVRSLEEAEAQLKVWRRFLDDRPLLSANKPDQEMLAALSDDLNTHQALMRLNELFHAAKNDEVGLAVFISSARFMGLLIGGDHGFFSKDFSFDVAAIDALIAARIKAREVKDWRKSDAIRDQLLALGIQIRDAKDPATGALKTEWEVKR